MYVGLKCAGKDGLYGVWLSYFPLLLEEQVKCHQLMNRQLSFPLFAKWVIATGKPEFMNFVPAVAYHF